MTMGIQKAADAVKIPAVKSSAAYCSGTTNEYVNIGNDARKITDERMKRKIFMVPPVSHTKKVL